jgi:hypothetical protein
MKTKILFIPLILLLHSGCKKEPNVLSSYNRWCNHWKNNNGTGVFKLVHKKLRDGTDAGYWKNASKDPLRKIFYISAKNKKEIQWKSKIKTKVVELKFKKTKNGWKMVTIPFPEYKKNTPKEAIVSFVMALEFQRLDILASLLTDEFRLSLSKKDLKEMFDLKRQEVYNLLTLLKKAVDSPIYISNNTAVLPYTKTKSLKLIRQENGWCIVDPD